MKKITIIWQILYPLFFMVLLEMLMVYAFIYNEQGRDFFVGVVQNGFPFIYVFKSSISLFLLCLVIWYGSRIIILIRRPHIRSGYFQEKAKRTIPVILGITPVLIISFAILQAVFNYQSFNFFSVFTHTWSLTIILAILLLLFIKSNSIALWLNTQFKTQSNTTIRKFRDLFRIGSHRIVLIGLVTVMIVLLFLFMLPQNIGFARWLQPATVVLIGLFFFTFLFTIFFLVFDLRKSPFFLLALSFIVAISMFNNNAAIRTIDNEKLSSREGIVDNFTKWIRSRNFPADTNSTFPIVIIAAEGGGIRSTAWTAQVLHKLNLQIPLFYQHVYAISAVSGGSVGSIFHLSYLHDLHAGKFKELPEHEQYFQKCITGDFLSDLTAGLIFHDNIQRILPFPVNALSRNRKLENSWSISYRHELFSNFMDSPFLNLWQKKIQPDQQLPNLFLNGMISETGQKAIVSNLDLDEKVFADDVDILQILNRNIPVKTSASISSQFPIITPGALLKKNNHHDIGHILDGGYKDNSGLETAIQIFASIHNEVKKAEKELKKDFPVYLVFIRNSEDPASIDQSISSTNLQNKSLNQSLKDTSQNQFLNKERVSAFKIMPDLTTIIPGFMHAWNRKTQLYSNSIKLAMQNESMNKEFKYFEIRLDNSSKFLPLGWYLSDSAKANITHQTESINANHELVRAFE